MKIIVYILLYIVCVCVTYFAHYYYMTSVYSRSKQIQSNYSFKEYEKESFSERVLISCFWVFVLLSIPLALITYGIYRVVEFVQNIIKKHFNIKS